jgi:hypothetical protein
MNPGVKLLAVSKTFSTGDVLAAVEAGLREFGESKIQEAQEKVPAVNSAAAGVKWHFIGHLQTNKAGKAASLFDCIQSVDSLRLAQKVSDSLQGRAVDVLVEVKVSGEDAKFGINPDEAAGLIEGMNRLQGIRVKGLMTMAPYSENPEDARPYFREARKLFDSLKKAGYGMEVLSMGMSGDYEAAIQEGSTMVRIGTAIFGKRL